MIDGLPDCAFVHTLRVRHDEMGADRLVRDATLLGWLQDLAVAQSEPLGFGQDRYDALGAGWVLRELDLAITAWPGHGERLELATWAVAFRRVQARRAYLVERDGERLVSGMSAWAFVTLAGRPTALPPGMVEAYGFAPGPELAALDPAAGLPLAEMHRTVEWRDIDLMQHANNAAYADWAEEARRRSGERRRPARLRLRYEAAALPAEDVTVTGTTTCQEITGARGRYATVETPSFLP